MSSYTAGYKHVDGKLAALKMTDQEGKLMADDIRIQRAESKTSTEGYTDVHGIRCSG